MTVRHRISQAGEVEEALRRSEAKYRAIFENMQDIFFQTDRQGFIVEVSASVERYGYAREELIGTPAAGVYEDPGKRITLTQLLENGEVTDREVRLKARDGRVVDCSLSFHMLRDPDGAPAGTEGCLRDISDRKRVEEELQRHRDRLEELVGERTVELRRANAELLSEVNERKRAEETLRESEERFRLLAASVPVGIFQTDAEGKIEYVNQRVLKITGLTALEETADWRWGIDPHPDDREAVLAERTKAMAEGRVFLGDFRILTPQGVTRWVETRICPLFNEKGEQIGHAGMVEDVTERHQAEEALRESEKRFRTLYESSRDGIAAADPDGRFTECNQAYADMLGYSRQELQRIRYQDITPSKWHTLNADAVREAMERGYSEEFEKEYTKKDGTALPVSLRIWRIEDEAGRPIGIWTIARDITERKRAEEVLRESEQRFSKAFHASPLAIVIATVSEGRIVDVNEGFLQLMGYSREEVIGRTSLEIGIWVDSKGRERMVQEALKRGSVPDWELRVRTRSGETRVWLGAFVTIELDGVPCLLGMSRDITEHRQAEDALRESEKRLASIYDTVGDVIFLLDVEKDGGYRFTSVNHAFLSVTGLPAEAVVGKRVNDVIPEPSLTLVLGKYRQAVQKKAVVHWEETSDYPAGRLTGEVSVVAVFDEGGNCTHLVGTVHDITERKKADDALRESERRFRQVLDVSADMIYKLDLESDTFDYISPSVLEMTGFTREEFIAMGPRGLRRRIHPENWPDLRRGSEEFVELGSHPGFEYRLQCKDGEYRWLSDNRSLVRGESGRPLALVGTVRDVTERRRAEEALRESEERFRSLSAAAPIGIMLIDNKDGMVYCNKRFLSIFGLPKEEAMGFGWVKSLHPDDREAFLAERSKAMAEGREFIREFRVVAPQGETRWLSVHTTPLLSQEGVSKSRVGTLADITERKQAEERDRQLHAEHVRANELRRMVRILEQMAATLGHELRNPLGVISNSAYFLLGQADLPEKARKHVEIVSREVTSAKRVIDDILEFAHVPDLLLAPADINAIVNGTIARSQIPATVRVFRNLAPDLPLVVCDAERLERAFIDIITNAIQAMPHGGRLDAKTHPSAGGVTVVFSDSGEGIAPENLPKVFEPMFTTKLRGMGLGLTVVRRTIELHKGEVEIKSGRRRGTTVEITLPLG